MSREGRSDTPFVDFAAGATILREGDAASALFIIEAGKVAIERNDAPGVVLAELGPGEFFGEMSILQEQPHSANAIARTAVRALRVDAAAFHAVLRENVEVAVHLMRRLVLRLKHADQRRLELEAQLARSLGARASAAPASESRAPDAPAPAAADRAAPATPATGKTPSKGGKSPATAPTPAAAQPDTQPQPPPPARTPAPAVVPAAAPPSPSQAVVPAAAAAPPPQAVVPAAAAASPPQSVVPAAAAAPPQAAVPAAPAASSAAPAAAPVPAAVPAAAPARSFALRHSDGLVPIPADRTECVVARPDPATGAVPEINLGPLDLARSLSRRHARLFVIDNAVTLREEPGVANGTWVNGERLAAGQSVSLKPGDKLRFGAIELEFTSA